jgi:hypothetical protein
MLSNVPCANPQEFRAWLQQEFDHRRAANPQYSLRAFASTLEISHSSLSQILRGKRALTEKAMACLLPHLDWTADMRSLLGLAARPGFRPDVRRCAKTLGISVDAVAMALQRLVRKGRLRMEGEQWVPL